MNRKSQGIEHNASSLNLSHASQPPGGHPMEIWISYVLRAGVIFSAFVIAAGLLLLFLQGPRPGDPSSLQDFRALSGAANPFSLGSVLVGVLHGWARSIIQAGLLALVLTPVARVAMTVILFLAQRDVIFTTVTLIVLAILVLGLIGIGA